MVTGYTISCNRLRLQKLQFSATGIHISTSCNWLRTHGNQLQHLNYFNKLQQVHDVTPQVVNVIDGQTFDIFSYFCTIFLKIDYVANKECSNSRIL